MELKDLAAEARKLKEEYVAYEKGHGFKGWGVEQVYESLVSDVGDLGRLVQAKEGFREMPDLEQNLSHELAEILWAALALADHYGIDLGQAFMAEMRSRKEQIS